MSDTDGLRADPIQARGHRTRDAVLDAARGVLATYGEDELTTALVAERAGKSIGTVYRYFADRGAILNAILPGRTQAHQVLRERARQVALGYNAEHDDAMGTRHLILEAETRLGRYADDMARGLPTPRTRHDLVAAVALTLAALEQHDRAATRAGEEPQP